MAEITGIHGLVNGKTEGERCGLLNMVGLREEYMARYPGSGGKGSGSVRRALAQPSGYL